MRTKCPFLEPALSLPYRPSLSRTLTSVREKTFRFYRWLIAWAKSIKSSHFEVLVHPLFLFRFLLPLRNPTTACWSSQSGLTFRSFPHWSNPLFLFCSSRDWFSFSVFQRWLLSLNYRRWLTLEIIEIPLPVFLLKGVSKGEVLREMLHTWHPIERKIGVGNKRKQPFHYWRKIQESRTYSLKRFVDLSFEQWQNSDWQGTGRWSLILLVLSCPPFHAITQFQFLASLLFCFGFSCELHFRVDLSIC